MEKRVKIFACLFCKFFSKSKTATGNCDLTCYSQRHGVSALFSFIPLFAKIISFHLKHVKKFFSERIAATDM